MRSVVYDPATFLRCDSPASALNSASRNVIALTNDARSSGLSRSSARSIGALAPSIHESTATRWSATAVSENLGMRCPAIVLPMTAESKPEVTIPPGEPPSELVIEDLEEGDGAEATAGSTVAVHYLGVAWSSGQQFDSSWDRGEHFSFGLGAGQVIAGWDNGVAGMRVGGRRRLTIPPHLGYGARGAGGAIKPNETLVFVVDLVSVS